MKYLMGLALVVSLTGPAFAACPSGQTLKKVGTVFNSAAAVSGTNTSQIVDGPIAINAWSWACTGTACTPTVYDGDIAPDEVEVGDIVAERGGVASGGGFEEFTTPLSFNDGITVGGANVAGFMVYTCQP